MEQRLGCLLVAECVQRFGFDIVAIGAELIRFGGNLDLVRLRGNPRGFSFSSNVVSHPTPQCILGEDEGLIVLGLHCFQ
jgi:hypothetical protein